MGSARIAYRQFPPDLSSVLSRVERVESDPQYSWPTSLAEEAAVTRRSLRKHDLTLSG
jgi:hypothetical protein